MPLHIWNFIRKLLVISFGEPSEEERVEVEIHMSHLISAWPEIAARMLGPCLIVAVERAQKGHSEDFHDLLGFLDGLVRLSIPVDDDEEDRQTYAEVEEALPFPRKARLDVFEKLTQDQRLTIHLMLSMLLRAAVAMEDGYLTYELKDPSSFWSEFAFEELKRG